MLLDLTDTLGFGNEFTRAIFCYMSNLHITEGEYIVDDATRRAYKLALRNIPEAITTEVGEWVAIDNNGNKQVAYKGTPLVIK